MSEVRRVGLAAVVLGLCGSLSGCLVVGYTSGGGWWVWPGSLVLTVLMLLFFFLRRGR